LPRNPRQPRNKRPPKPSTSREWVWSQVLKALEPQPLVSISEFCDGHLQLSSRDAEPGPYRLSRTPYAKEPMDACSPSSKYRKIVLWTGTQLMKTQVELNTIYFYAVNSPTSILFVFSNAEQGKLLVKTRINPMIDANPDLKERIGSTRNNSKGDTANYKEFVGGFLKLGSGQSASSLKSTPCQIVIIDEFDEMPDNVEGQGTVEALAGARSSTFNGRDKLIISSTTTNNESKIAKAYETTDKRHYFVPCPICGEMIEFLWDGLHFNYEGQLVKNVWYECPKCHGTIDEHHKKHMVARGKWIPTNTKPTDPKSVGYWLSNLYSPWKSWASIATEYLIAKDEVEKGSHSSMMSFYNNLLALPYEVANDKPDWEQLYIKAKREGRYHRGQIPNEVMVLTSGADVQENRLEVEIKGWGRNGRCFSIDYYQIMCPPGTTTKDINNQCWNDYEQMVLRRTFYREDGVPLQILANAMDRGHNTPQVNAFWMRMNNPRFFLVRGNASMVSRLSMEKEDKGGSTRQGKSNQFRGSSYKFFDIGVNTLKAEVYANLLRKEQVQDGIILDTPYMMYFPDDYDEEYYRQLTAEKFIPPSVNKRHGEWVKDKQDRNEVLDCTNYALVGFYKLNLHSYGDREYTLLEQHLKSQQKIPDMKKATAQKRVATLVSKGIRY